MLDLEIVWISGEYDFDSYTTQTFQRHIKTIQNDVRN